MWFFEYLVNFTLKYSNCDNNNGKFVFGLEMFVGIQAVSVSVNLVSILTIVFLKIHMFKSCGKNYSTN